MGIYEVFLVGGFWLIFLGLLALVAWEICHNRSGFIFCLSGVLLGFYFIYIGGVLMN